MKRIVTFCALCALWGCRVSDAPEMEGIALSYSTSEQSKTDVLAQGDAIGVFAAIEGTEDYFLDNAKYAVGSDGRTLTYGSTVYYPDRKQAVAFTAYLPFGGTWSGAVGTFAVPTDQSTATALKQADLCWATASSTPAKTAVPLEFTHKLARLLVTTNTPTEKITIPNAFSGGTLDIKTGVFTNTIKATLSTTGTELILPAQTVTRLILTVANIEYVFEGSINLLEGHTTSLSLTLNPTQKTATLSGSSTTNWIGSATQGNPTQAVSNVLTIHWPNYVPEGATPNKVVLTINNVDYTVSGSIIHSGQSFTVPFASAALRYPYTISKITFYQGVTQVVPACVQLLGSVIYKSAALTLGIKDQANAIKIGKLWWATGNLIADGAQGTGSCRIGAPTDYGLYFQFGSLIGYKGGALANGGTGVGSNPYTTDGTHWNGASSFSWANDAIVWPSVMTKTPSAWPANYGSAVGDRTTVVDQYFFNYNVAPYSTTSQDIRGFSEEFTGDAGSGNLGTGRYAKWGVGDPCTYYLGGTWRLPTGVEYAAMCNNQTGINTYYSWADAGGTWVPGSGGNLQGSKLFFPASGDRRSSNGSFNNVTVYGFEWSSSVYSAKVGLSLNFRDSGVDPRGYSVRSYGLSVRCVSN